MFNLGSKKSAAANQLWNLQLLTTGYLVEGSLQPDDFESGGEDLFALAGNSGLQAGGVTAFQHLRLANARVRPTGNLTTPEQTFAEWGLSTLDEFVAIIPQDPASLQSAQAAFKDYRHPLDVMVYAGPYRMRAKLLADASNRKQSPFAMTQLIPLTQAVIDCHLPGAHMVGFNVPWLLLNASTLLHGYGIL